MNTKSRIDFWHCEACEWVGEKHEAATKLDGNATKLYCPDCHNTLTKGQPTMMKSKHAMGACPSCNWKGEEPEFLHAFGASGRADVPICPECCQPLKIIEIESITVPFSKTDKPATVEEETW